MKPAFSDVVSRYGAEAKAKLANPGATGEPEDQLRAPLETLFADLTEICGLPRAAFAAVGESSIADLKTRPDYAVTLRNGSNERVKGGQRRSNGSELFIKQF